ncbi:tetratricopeptide repeat protein [Fodinibius sediminis]|uniref:Tetratricopeptide repeat-containing protein n=1 Tax=Fodinibius sediminis TaxID=1214077 RepID=A0A521BLP6_9BACT|nr:tetratricopeptide repeat protein [Fodinibius sediminis]SMO47721.1 Tetratricopeptide repeat-containing protein [Fodinibius sediminis]
MKKTFAIIYLLLGLAFLYITYQKYTPGSGSVAAEVHSKPDREQQELMAFWDDYNQATERRIAGDYDSAARYYRQALDIKPAHLNSLYYMGNMQLELAHFDKAESHWVKLIERNDASARGYIQLGNLYGCQSAGTDFYNLARARRHFDKALVLNPEVSGPLLQIAKIELIQGRMKEAARHLREVLKSNFRSTEAFFLQGFIAWKHDDLSSARHLLEQSKIILTDGDEKYANVGEGQSGSVESAVSSPVPRCDLLRDEIHQLIQRYAAGPSFTAYGIYGDFEERLARFPSH